MTYQVWAARLKNVERDDYITDTFVGRGESCNVNATFNLQGQFDSLAEAVYFCYLLHKCGKWTTTHIREVAQ